MFLPAYFSYFFEKLSNPKCICSALTRKVRKVAESRKYGERVCVKVLVVCEEKARLQFADRKKTKTLTAWEKE